MSRCSLVVRPRATHPIFAVALSAALACAAHAGQPPACEWAWSPVGEGARSTVYALTVFDDGTGPALYSGGHAGLTSTLRDNPDGKAGGYVDSRFLQVARWNGSSWSPLGSTPIGGYIHSLTAFDDGTGPALYAAGAFRRDAGGKPANNIARWDGVAWSTLGEGVSIRVYALTVFDDGNGPALYVGGLLSQAGGNPVNRIARWDGSTWSDVGEGVLGGPIYSMTVFDDGTGPALYVAGTFNQAGGIPANNIARWDGSSWSALGEGLGGQVWAHSMTTFDDGTGPALYVAGLFNQAGGIPANNIARWDGSSWSALGEGLNNGALALTTFDEGNGPALYVGGTFTQAGGNPANGIARWDGSAWSTLRSGVLGSVFSMTTLGDQLYVGGSFLVADGKLAFRIARWACTTPCPADLTAPPPYGGFRDGQVDAADLDYYINLWINADPAADLTGPTLDAIPDGNVGVSDLNYYITIWLDSLGPCP